MEFIPDGTGGVAVEVARGKYVGVIPFTIYQLERYIFEKAPPGWESYRRPDTLRIPPGEITESNLPMLFFSGINFETASKILGSFGGRFPSHGEWLAARCMLCCNEMLSGVADFMARWGETDRVDPRVLRILEQFYGEGGGSNALSGLLEMVTEYPESRGVYGRLFAMSGDEHRSLVAGNPPSATRDDRFVFSMLLERQ